MAFVSDHGHVTLELANAERLRGELQSFLGVTAPSGPPDVEVLSSSQQDGFVRHRVHLIIEDDVIPSLLAAPSGAGPFPAVVVFHQHAGQRHLGKSEVFGLVGEEFQAFGPALARAGFVVLAPDSIAFEDRRRGRPSTEPRDDDWDQHYNALAYRLVAGDTLMRKVLEDGLAAVSALLARPDVRTEAVAALGHSYGGNTALFLTAVDARVGFGCASGAVASYRRKVSDGTGIEMAEVIPAFTTRFDVEHVLAAIAPRHFLVVSGTDDKYSADADEVVELARPAFRARNAPDALSHLRVVGGHALEAQRFEAIVDWLVRTGTRSE
jgi:dienelactone hydrolase